MRAVGRGRCGLHRPLPFCCQWWWCVVQLDAGPWARHPMPPGPGARGRAVGAGQVSSASSRARWVRVAGSGSGPRRTAGVAVSVTTVRCARWRESMTHARPRAVPKAVGSRYPARGCRTTAAGRSMPWSWLAVPTSTSGRSASRARTAAAWLTCAATTARSAGVTGRVPSLVVRVVASRARARSAQVPVRAGSPGPAVAVTGWALTSGSGVPSGPLRCSGGRRLVKGRSG